MVIEEREMKAANLYRKASHHFSRSERLCKQKKEVGVL
jgi:hypothetical protein